MPELFTIPHKLYGPYFDLISLYKPEVEFNVLENQLFIATFDSARNQMIKSTLKIPTKEQCIFRLSIQALVKLSPKEDITFSINDSFIHVRIGNGTIHTLRTIDMRLKSISTAELPKKFEPDCSISLTPEVTASIAEAMRIANSEAIQKVDFIIKDNFVTMHTKASEEHSIDTPIGIVEGNTTAKSRFSSEYIAAALKHHKLYEVITLHLGTDMPCHFEMKSAMIDTSIWISPRIENE